MENVTSPGQILFLFAGFVVFCCVAGWWLFSGIPKDAPRADDESTGELIGRAWSELIHWRPSVNDYQDVAPYVMSRSEDSAPPSRGLSLETHSETDRQTESAPRIRAEELLTLYKLMRASGIDRESAAAAFKACGLPFNNNVWTLAAPPPKVAPVDAPAEYRTPIVGRPTNAKFETDPEYPYQAPA